MSHLAIFALGPLRIEIEGQPAQTSRHKALALLVYLALHPGKQSRQTLSALLWPDFEQKKASAYLRRTLWEIHNFLGDGWLESDRQAIGFNPNASLFLDVAEFQSHLAALGRHDHPASDPCPECSARLNTAARLYRGDFLDGFSLRDSAPFEDWQILQREALRGDYGRALQKLADLLFQASGFSQAAAFAQRWLALDNYNEDAHRLLMKIHACDGQRHQAVRQYQECQRILQAELGIPPDPATTALYESIVSGKFMEAYQIPAQQIGGTDSVVTWLGEALSAKQALAESNLPAPSTPFIGRKQELARISSLLDDPDCWLLTLTGPGGIGKTRLAIQAGQQLSNQSTKQFFFIPLSAAETESAIAPAIARAIGLVFRQNGPAPEEQLLDFLREKQLLLILDSFEGLVQWASLLERIHAHTAGIQMLVTSRQRLMLAGEWLVEVKGLDYPPKPADGTQADTFQAYSAVELFLQAARRSQATFQAVPEDTSSINRITQLLEGMPLGLELAATWVNTLSIQEIGDEISRGIDFLETTLGTGYERQHSMRAVFDRSWDLLSRREQLILPHLAVFRGSFSRQAAEQMASLSLGELAGFVDKSLVRRNPHGRFDLHDLLRQYCTEKLDEQPADSLETHHRHCDFYSTRLADWKAALNGERQGQVLQEMETDIENIQAAWDWATRQSQLECLEQAVDGLCMFYLRRGCFADGWQACQGAIEAVHAAEPEGRKILPVRLRTWQAAFCMNLDRFEEADLLLQENRIILDDPHLDPQQMIPERIFVLSIQSILANLHYDPAATIEFYEQACQLSQKAIGKIPAFFIFFWRYLMGGSPSRELYQKIEKWLAGAQRSGDPFELGCYLFVLGIGELFHDYRMEKAEPLLMESSKNFQRVEDPSTQVMFFMTLGYLLSVQGKFEECLALKRGELEIYQNIGDRRMIGIAQAEIGEILFHLGKYSEAEDQIRAGMVFLLDRSESQYALRQRYLGDALMVQGKFSSAREAYLYSYNYFHSVNEKGWTLTALTGLSRAELALGDRTAAWEYIYQALQIYHDIRMYTFFAYLSLAEFALLLASQGEIIPALELYGLVMRQGYLAQSPWFADLYGRQIESAAAGLSLEEQDAARQRGQRLDFAKTVARLLNEFSNTHPSNPVT